MKDAIKSNFTQIIEPCGEGKNLVAITKPSKREEVIEKVVSNLDKIAMKSNVFVKGYYRGIEIVIYTSGKIMLKNIRNREEGEEILEKLLE